MTRYKSASESAEKVEDELKVEKRKLQREVRRPWRRSPLLTSTPFQSLCIRAITSGRVVFSHFFLVPSLFPPLSPASLFVRLALFALHLSLFFSSHSLSLSLSVFPSRCLSPLQLRSALDRIDELEASNSHLSKRLEKMKANRTALLAQQ